MTTRSFYEPQSDLTWRMVYDLLVMVSADPDPGKVQMWTPIELLVAYDWAIRELVAYDWAIREHLIASDSTHIRRRAKPWFIEAPSPAGDD